MTIARRSASVADMTATVARVNQALPPLADATSHIETLHLTAGQRGDLRRWTQTVLTSAHLLRDAIDAAAA
jgi:hypothetical protein